MEFPTCFNFSNECFSTPNEAFDRPTPPAQEVIEVSAYQLDTDTADEPAESVDTDMELLMRLL